MFIRIFLSLPLLAHAELVDLQETVIDRQASVPLVFSCNHTMCNDNPIYEDFPPGNYSWPPGTKLISVYIYLTPLLGRTCNTGDSYTSGYDPDAGVSITNNRYSSPVSPAYLIMPSTDTAQNFENRTSQFNTQLRSNALLGVNVNSTMLQAGINYRLCVDYDGTGSDYNFEATTLDLYVGGPYRILSPWMFQSTQSSIVTFLCYPNTCDTSWQIFLKSSGCDGSVSNPLLMGYSELTSSKLDMYSNGDGVTFHTFVSTPGLGFGNTFFLCFDPDGAGAGYSDGFPRLSVQLGGLNPAYTDDNGLFIIRTTASEQFQFECLGCHSASPIGPTAYLRFGQFAGCDSTDFDGEKPASGTTVSKSSLLTGTGNMYTFEVDASTLLVGGMYRICVDFDGSALFMPFLVSHRRVVVSPVKHLRKKYVAGPNDRDLIIDMMPGYDTSIRGAGYLGERCDPTQSGFISAGLGQTNQCQIRYQSGLGYWQCTIEAINLLTYMKMYHFCYDADGTGTVNQFQETGFKVVMGIGEAFGGFSLPVGGALAASPAAKISFFCPEVHCPAGVIMAYIALDRGTAYEDRSCLAHVFDGGVNATGQYQTSAVVGYRGGTNLIEFTVDSSNLMGGARYRMCVDRDGAGSTYSFGEAGLVLYMSPITEMVTIAIFEKYDQEVVRFVCPTCIPQVTLAYLAVASVSGSPFLYDQKCDVNNMIGTTERKGNLNTESFPLKPITAGSTTFEMSPIVAGVLRAGQFYKICIDLDGTSPNLGVGYSGKNVYISTVYRVEPRAVAPTVRVLVQLYCDHCNPDSDLTEFHITKQCDFSRIGGNQRLLAVEGYQAQSQLCVGPAGSSALTNTRQFMDSRPLTPGENYNLCTDTDGEAFVRAMGDTGLRMYTNAILSVDKYVIFKTSNQTLTFTCSSTDLPTCSENSTVYLGETECDLLDADGDKEASEPGNSASTNLTQLTDTTFSVQVDATNLRPGWYYRVCQDLDGASGPQTFGDTGYDIYVSPIKTMSQQGAIEKNANTHAVNRLTVTCWEGGNCDANTRVHVDTACNKDVLDGLNAAAAGTSGVDINLEVNPVNKQEFFAALDASVLTVGLEYKMCVDLDGYTTVNPWGESGFPIYIRNLKTATNKFMELQTLPKAQYQMVRVQGTHSSDINTETTLYFDYNGCDTSIGNGYSFIAASGSTRSRSQVISGDPSGVMETEIDVSNLETGFFYHLCVDKDGEGNALKFGDSGFKFYITPFDFSDRAIQPRSHANVSPFVDASTLKSTIRIDCPSCVSNVTSAYLTFAPSRTCPEPRSMQDTIASDAILASDPNLKGIIAAASTLQLDANYTLHGNRYKLEQDTDAMLVGGHYWLCTDLDGPGPKYVGDSGYKIYVTPVPTEYIGAVPTQAGQTITFTCNGCTTETYAYLTRLRGDEPTGCHDTRTGTTRPRVDNTGNENNAPAKLTLVSAATNQWSLSFDAGPFYQGELYILCIDLDGDLTTFYNGASYTLFYGNTGAHLFLSLVSGLLYRRILPQANQRINYVTPFGGQTTDIRIYLVHLYGMCEYDSNSGVMTADGDRRTRSYEWLNQAGQWHSIVDASALQNGMVYRICMDYDGIGNEKYFADTFQQVYVLDMAIVTPGIIQAVGQQVFLTCVHCVAGSTSVYLTSEADCDIYTSNGVHVGVSPTTSDAVVLSSTATPHQYLATVDASQLTSGNRYKVCVDLDGGNGTLPFGYTELSTYITGATLADDTVVAAKFGQKFAVVCSVCSTATTLHLSKIGCDTTDFDAGQVSNGALGSAFAPLVAETSALVPTAQWSATVDASLLNVGEYYTICTDLDGATTNLASGDAQQFVYVSPPNIAWRSDKITGTNTYVDWIRNHTNVINSATNQKLQIYCPTGCDANTTAYLGTTCQSGATGAITAMNTKLELEETGIGDYAQGSVYSVTLDTSAVETGKDWKLCLITSGSGDQPGWSQLMVHTTPATGIETRHRYFKQAAGQVITFECPSCVAGVSTVYLAAQFPTFVPCFETESGLTLSTKIPSASNSLAALLQNATTLPEAKYLPNNGEDFRQFEIDGTRLQSGWYYHICVDRDGEGAVDLYGDSLQTLFLTPIELATTTLTQSSEFRFEVKCPLCKVVVDREVNVTRTVITVVPILVFYENLENVTEITWIDNETFTSEVVEKFVTRNYTNGSQLEYSYYGEFIDGVTDYLEAGGLQAEGDYATTAYIGTQDCKERYVTYPYPELLNMIDTGVNASAGNRTAAAYQVNKSAEELLDPRKAVGWFNFTFDTSHLLVGKTYSLCVDLDGKGGFGAYGYSGIELFVSTFGVLEVEARESFAASIFPEQNQTLRASCSANCVPGETKAYLVTQKIQLEPLCETMLSADTGESLVQPIYAGELSQVVAAATAVASPASAGTSLANKFDFVFDARSLQPGGMYRLCVDYGNANFDSGVTPSFFGDTGLTVYVSGVVHLVTTGLVIGLTMAYADISLFCTTRTLALDGEGVCSTNSMAYLSTQCDQSVTDSVPMNNITTVSEVVPFRISYLDTQKLTPSVNTLLGGGGATTSAGDQAISDNSTSSSQQLATYTNTTIDTEAMFSTQLSELYNGTLFQLRLNTRQLVDGRHFRVCTDLDGFAGPQFMGDTGMLIYTAKIPFVDLRRVQAFDGVPVNFTCVGCTNLTEGYLLNAYSGRCDVRDGGGNATAVAGVQTESTRVQLSFDFGGYLAEGYNTLSTSSSTTTTTAAGFVPEPPVRQFFPFNAGHLVEGYDYRMCVDLNTNNSQTFFYGDLMYLVYLTPVTSVDASVLYSEAGALKFACKNCTDADTVAFLAEDCAAEGLTASKMKMTEANVTGITLPSATKSGAVEDFFLVTQDVKSALDVQQVGFQFTLGKYYELCLDMDGDGVPLTASALEQQLPSKPMRYSGWSVFVQSIDLLHTTSVHAAAAQTIFFRCLPGGTCSQFVAGYLSESLTDCGQQATFPALFMESAGYVGLNYFAFANLDASALLVGRTYGLCVDYGHGFGQTGHQVYVHPIAGTPVATLTYRSGVPIAVEVYLCPACEQYADDTYAFLSADNCDDDNRFDLLQKLTKQLIVVSNTYRYFIQVPDPDSLQIGKSHLICTAVNSTAVARTFYTNEANRGFGVLNDTIVGNTHVAIYINFAYDYSSTIFYAFPKIETVEESTIFGPQTIIPEWSGQGWAFSSANGTDGFSNLTLGSRNESALLNMSNVLRYTDANRTQRLGFSCDKCGSQDGVHALYVGLVCQKSITDGVYPFTVNRNTDAVVVYNDAPSLPQTTGYYADVNFGYLQPGGSYDICVDYNRLSSAYAFDYAGQKVLVTGVTGSLNTTLYANLTQTVTVVCNTCTEKTKAYLGLTCFPEIKTGVIRSWQGKRTSAATFAYFIDQSSYGGSNWNGTLFAITVDATVLSSGVSYKLCVDEDGPMAATGFEDVRLSFEVF